MNEREKLAEALGDIRVADARQADWWTNDEEHALLIRVLRGECVPWAEGLIAAGWVSPETLAEAKARAKAEALREFADECDGPDSSLHVMGAAQAARERADRIEGEHHPDCYQVVGVPDDLPDDLCDCRVLRLIEGATDER